MIDAEEILATSEFTKDVALPNGAGTVKGVFDNQPAEIFGEVRTPNPMVTLSSAVAATLNENDQLIISGTNYYVAEIGIDDEGLTEINLHT